METDLLEADATGQLAALAAKRVSAEELLKLSLARHADTHGQINAVVAVDLEGALSRARVIDETRARGGPLGPLAGLPMTLKDTFDVQGLPASAGLDHFRHRRAEDAVVAGHVRQAGAVIWGKTNVPVMAGDWQTYNGVYGTTNNPWDPKRTTGGSSGGAAAALATGVTALEIGSDIGGSLRVPANFCGVFSHKPSWGLVSQLGHVPPNPGARAERDLNVVGPMARSVRDLRLLLSLIAQGPVAAKAPPADLTKTRIGVWLDDPNLHLDPEVRAVIEAFVADLAKAGAQIQVISSPVAVDQLLEAYQVLLGSIIGADMPPAQQRGMRRMRGLAEIALRLGASPNGNMALVRDYTATHAEWLAANEVRARMRHDLASIFDHIDVILAPITPVVAFPHDQRAFQNRRLTTSDGQSLAYTSLLNWIALATACHLPATTVPAGQTPGGLPVGVQLIGAFGADSKTLSVAQAIDETVRGFKAPS